MSECPSACVSVSLCVWVNMCASAQVIPETVVQLEVRLWRNRAACKESPHREVDERTDQVRPFGPVSRVDK